MTERMRLQALAGSAALKRLFGDPLSAAASVLCIGAALILAPSLVDWALFSAVWRADDPALCAAPGAGACWGFIREKFALILFGAYPHDQIWRPALGCATVLATVAALAVLGWPMRWTAAAGVSAFVVLAALLDGRPFGLEAVDSVRWHGLAIVALLGVFSIAAALPLGLLIALARRDGHPDLRYAATAYVELLRSAPLVIVLFFGIFIFPLMTPPGLRLDPVMAALLALTMFHAAYFAEDFRGALASVDAGQPEAAAALGLRYAERVRLVELPQAFALATPSLTNTIIGGFKDTSLVAVVGVFDLLATTRMAYSDPAWQRHALEGLIFVGALYLTACWAVARHSAFQERKSAVWRAPRRESSQKQ